MASPWNLLARLMPKRWKEPQGGLADDVKSDEATSPEPVEAATDNTPHSNDRLVEGEPQPAHQADEGVIVPEHSATAVSRVRVKVGLESAVDAAGPVLSDDGDFTAISTHNVLTPAPSKKGANAKTKRTQETSVVKSVEVFHQRPTSVPTFADEAQGLDEEIRELRDQLARKLQSQNAQLKRMLERFER